MKKYFLIVAIIIIAALSGVSTSYSQAVYSQSDFKRATSPLPFSEVAWQDAGKRLQATASTGYWFAENSSLMPASSLYKWLPTSYAEEGVPDNMRPGGLLSTDFERNLWKRIRPGYRSTPVLERERGLLQTNGYWTIVPPNDRNGNPIRLQEGYAYFRNPAEWQIYTNPGAVGSIDSTRHAFAGPIPLGFAFYMNGLRYDSFYVSTNGVIALSNRRYMYDGNQNRVISPLSNDCYDPNSADWPFISVTGAGLSTGDLSNDAKGNSVVPDQGRAHFARGSAESLEDPVPDNYGFQYLALGGSLNSQQGIHYYAEGVPGINGARVTNPTIQMRLMNPATAGGAFITPFDGPFYMPNSRAEGDRGKVWYKRDASGSKLIIYFENFRMATSPDNTVQWAGVNAYTYITGGNTYRFPINEGNPAEVQALEGSVQVELNRLDSSITFRYGNWSEYAIIGYTDRAATLTLYPHELFSKYASIAVGGYARHVNYNSKTGQVGAGVDDTNPWAGQYRQFTQTAYNHFGSRIEAAHTVDNFSTDYMVKFKQWRNSLRLVDIQYMMKAISPTATVFDRQITTNATQNEYNPIELLAGNSILGQIQPIAIVQNLTNDIQGQKGVNFIEQDFQFQTWARITNVVTDKIIYNRVAKIADTCLIPGTANFNGDAARKITYCGAESLNWGRMDLNGAGEYEFADASTTYESEGLSGIPPYNVAQVRFTAFEPGENLTEQLGLMELTAFVDATHPITGARVGDQWPVDDSAYTNFWVISRVSNFRANGEFNTPPDGGVIPDVTKWVHSRANGMPTVTIATATGSSANPVPPLGPTYSLNEYGTGFDDPLYIFNTVGNGSKLTSFPVDLRHKQGSVLTLAVQKGLTNAPTNRGFADGIMVGPEPRVSFLHYYESKATTPGSGGRMAGFGVGINVNQQYQADPDYLFVEYLLPSPNGVSGLVSTGSEGNGSNVNDVFHNSNNAFGNDVVSVENNLWRNHKAYNAIDRTFYGGNAYDVLNAPALAVFGGGGYFVGWTFADGKIFFPSSWNFGANTQNGLDVYGGSGVVTLDRNTEGALYNANPTPAASGDYPAGHEVVAGFVPNPFDIGFDDEFHRYSVIIPNNYIDAEVAFDGGQNFRFRIKTNDVAAGVTEEPKRAGKGVQNNPSDDNDNFLIDNVAIMTPNALPDLEAQVVKILWPYATVPVTQATNMQMVGRIANMGTVTASNFNVKMRVYKGKLLAGAFDVDDAIFCQSIPVPSLEAGSDLEVTANNISLREYSQNTTPGSSNDFTLHLVINSNNNDQYQLNDTIYSYFTIIYDTVMSYVNSRANDVPQESGIAGKGLNLGGSSIGGFAVNASANDWRPSRGSSIYIQENLSGVNAPYGGIYLDWWSSWDLAGTRKPWSAYVTGGNLDQIFAGHPHGYISGQIAVKIDLRQADSLRGVIAQYGGANQEANDISFNVYYDNNGLPGDAVQHTSLPLLGRRLHSKSATGVETLRGTDVPVLYEFNRPVSLPAGIYWVSIDQLGQTGLELAASGEGMGMRTMLVHAERVNSFIPAMNGHLGTQGMQLLVNKRFRVPEEDPIFGRVYKNNNIFAYKNVLGSANAWQPFMPTEGQVAYPHLNHLGMLSPENNNYQTFTRGTWAPLLIPYFGNRTVTQSAATQRCPDDVIEGGDQGGGLAITVSSFNAYGRKTGIELIWEAVTTESNIHFIVEKTEAAETDNWQVIEHLTGSASNIYRLLDADVQSGKTYKYRLYNMYPDGSITCQNNNIVTIDYNNSFAVELSQNSPNPFNSETNIDVAVPEAQYVTIEILDIFGKVVNTLASNELLQGSKRYVWNGRDSQGMAVADGHYIYRLTAGNETITKKMSLIRAN